MSLQIEQSFSGYSDEPFGRGKNPLLPDVLWYVSNLSKISRHFNLLNSSRLQ